MRTFKVEGDEAWAKLVGEIVLLFGNVELLVSTMLIMIPTDSIVKSTKNLGLKHKITILEEILESRAESDICLCQNLKK